MRIGWTNALSFARGAFDGRPPPGLISFVYDVGGGLTFAVYSIVCFAVAFALPLVPLLVGAVSDGNGYAFALIVPAACYAALCLFAFLAGRAPILRREATTSVH